MRILIVSNITPYRIGGAENQARLLAEQFTRRGHDVIVAGYAVPTGRLAVPGLPGGVIQTYHLPTIQTNRITRALSFFFSLSRLLIFHQKTIDLIYCRFLGESVLVTAFMKCLGIVRRPLVACSECSGEVGDAAYIKTLPAATLLVYLLNRACCAINILSPKIAEELTALGIKPGLFIFIPNGVRLPPERKNAPLQANGQKSILFAGRLVPQKGVDDLLRAVHIIGKKGLIPRINIVGGGPLFHELQQTARELDIDSRVVFHGEVPPQEMADHYRANDLLVLPSHQEGQGMVVAEAMSFGLPVIVTRSGGPEYFVTKQNGIICPPAKPDALAAGVETMIRMSDRALTTMGQNGRQSVSQRFDIEYVADRLLERFTEAVHGNERT